MFLRGGISAEMLGELRAIRERLDLLGERIANAATRQDLAGYVTKERYEADQLAHHQRIEGWRFWAPYVPSAVALVWAVFGGYIHFGK